MLKNLLLIAYRHLFRHKAFSFINIAGLALGIAASLMLLRYVSFELSYDGFHANAANIYRLKHAAYKNGSLEFVEAFNYSGAGPAIKESFPDVVNVVRLHRADGMVSYQGADGTFTSYHEERSYYADSSFFSIFSFPLLHGNPTEVLRNPGSVLISESTAKRYFGSDNPVGKTLSLTTEWAGGEYVVEGVFRDIPENSHFKFDFLFAIERLLNNDQFINGAWFWSNFYTYLLVRPGTNVPDFEEKLSVIIDTHLGRELKKMGREEKLSLQSLQSIHLNSSIGGELDDNGNLQMVSFLAIIGFIVVCIAWLNYVNLSTAKATERAREVGIRKVLGSQKVSLIKQFLLESSLVTLMAVVVGAGITVVMNPLFDSLIGKQIPMYTEGQQMFWVGVLLFILSGTFVSSLYPAFVIASFQPLAVLRGRLLGGQKGTSLRRALVVFQYTASLILIIATITVYRQLRFMRAQDLGMNISQRMVIRAPRVIKGNSYLNAMDNFRARLKDRAHVIAASSSSEVPGKEIFWGNFIRLASLPEDTQKPANLLAVDESFIETYQMTLLAGRNFSKDRPSDLGNTVIINESALRLLEFKSPESAIGEELVVAEGLPRKIIGVIRDFHQQSLQHPTVQLVLQYIPWHNDYVTISFAGPVNKKTIEDVAMLYREVFPQNAFDYFFLDDQFNAQYGSEERSTKLFVLFAVLSIVVAGMGLFGLASFLTIQRSREIAIRKVVGASVASIAVLMSGHFVRLVLVAFALATPLSWLLMNRWLSTYPYRINQVWWTFAGAGSLIFIVAVLTVGFHSVRAALANPVSGLKTE